MPSNTPSSDGEEAAAAKTNDELESGKVEQETETETAAEEEEEEGEDIDEDLLELQKSNKPLSSCVAGTKFWCTFWIFPILFVGLNAFAISMFMVFDLESQFRHNYYDSYDSFDEEEELDGQDPNDRIFLLVRKNLLALAIISFIDTLLLLLAKIHVLRDVKKLNEIEDGKAEHDGKSHVLGTVSR
ncbi:MAG: hypothetical protein SGBAC_013166, partial [Bacillariaceae sp.]